MNLDNLKLQLKYPDVVTSTEEESGDKKTFLNVCNLKCAEANNAFFSINKNIDYKNLCEKNDKVSCFVKRNNSNYFERFDIKLPPIVVPILKNLTNQEPAESKFVAANNCESNNFIEKLDYKLQQTSAKNLESSQLSSRQDSKSELKKSCSLQIEKDNSLFTVIDDNGVAYGKAANDCSVNNYVLIKSNNGNKSTIGMSMQQQEVQPQNNDARFKLRSNNDEASVVNYPLQRIMPVEREQGVDYLVEVVGHCLNIYGQGALRFIDKQWDSSKANEINFVRFHYVHFNNIALCLNKLKSKFPNVDNFVFKDTNISHLGQLNALAESQGLNSITIESEGNPIMSKDWTIYAIFRLAHWGLQVVNGKKVTEENIQVANTEYSGLVDMIMWSLPENLLQPLLQRLQSDQTRNKNDEIITAKQLLLENDTALRSVVGKEALQWRRSNITQDDLIWRHKGKSYFSKSIENTVTAIDKLNYLKTQWPNYLFEIVHNIIKDYSNMLYYMKICIQELQENLSRDINFINQLKSTQNT